MTFLAEDNLKALYGSSVYDSSSDSEWHAELLRNTMPLPLKTNDPVRRKLFPWFEDFESYRFKDSYIIYYTSDKDEIYLACASLFTLQMLLINVNLDNQEMRKKAKKYVRHPDIEWRIVAGYCMTYGHKITRKLASVMTIKKTVLRDY